MTEIGNLPGLALDGLMVATKIQDLFEGTGLAGLLPPFKRTAVLGLQDSSIAVTLLETPFEPEDRMVGRFDSAEQAAVEFSNALDMFRRNGWTVRDPDPWELPDPTEVSAPF